VVTGNNAAVPIDCHGEGSADQRCLGRTTLDLPNCRCALGPAGLASTMTSRRSSPDQKNAALAFSSGPVRSNRNSLDASGPADGPEGLLWAN